MKIVTIAIVGLLMVFLLIIFAQFIAAPTVNDVGVNTDATIRAGEGEACITPTIEIDCEEGLECVLLSEYPRKNGVCLPAGTELEEDFINRNPNAPKTNYS